jgi:hypothetical protein
VRVRISRRGGLAGVPLSAEVETGSLADETVARLERLVREHAGKPPGETVPPHPDAFMYEIALPDWSQSALVAESEIPLDLRRLMRELLATGTVGSTTSADETR